MMVKIGLSWKLFAVLLLSAAVFIGVMVAAVHLSVSRNFEVFMFESLTLLSPFEGFHSSKFSTLDNMVNMRYLSATHYYNCSLKFHSFA